MKILVESQDDVRLQRIFDTVMDDYIKDQRSMCMILEYAAFKGLICASERDFAISSINKYMGEVMYLRMRLQCEGLPCEDEDRLAIFKDWKNRPALSDDISWIEIERCRRPSLRHRLNHKIGKFLQWLRK